MRLPSTLQQLVLIFARLFHTYPEEIIELLTETSVESRISLKVLLDKWLLQQPLFSGTYTKTVTMTALLKMFMMRDSRVESLLVVGYNPSHKNIKSEVNAPFKILSTLLRFLASESKEKVKKGDAKFAPNGERLDTHEDYNDLYDDDDDNGSQFDDSFRYGESDDDGCSKARTTDARADANLYRRRSS